MAYIVTAYTFMVCTVVPYVAVAYIVVAYIVMAYSNTRRVQHLRRKLACCVASHIDKKEIPLEAKRARADLWCSWLIKFGTLRACACL